MTIRLAVRPFGQLPSQCSELRGFGVSTAYVFYDDYRETGAADPYTAIATAVGIIVEAASGKAIKEERTAAKLLAAKKLELQIEQLKGQSALGQAALQAQLKGGQWIGGVPNWLVIGGAGLGAYFLLRRR